MLRTFAGVAALAVIAGSASAQVKITELYIGAPDGDNGTADWMEITNLGAVTVNTSGWYYDDDSADPTKNDPLSALDIDPGESAIFLISWEDDFATSADAVTAFESYWGAGIQIGYVTGGSGLGAGGDAAFVFDGNTGGAAMLASAAYSGAYGDQYETIEYMLGGSKRLSVNGENGAYESLLTAGIPAGSLVGSPGAIPAPGAMALAAGAGLLGLRRRRA